MIPVAKPVFDEEMKKAALDALSNEKFVMGDSVLKFEEEFAKYLGTDFAVSTSSGTDALQIALISAGVKAGDEVVTTASSFIATANSVIHAGATPRFADIGSDNNVDPARAASAITSKTKALLPVHLYGLPARMGELNELAAKKGIFVLEDACQAHGSTYKGRKAGSLGNAACFSFYTTKNMMAGGDGGMITSSDEKFAKLAAKLRNCGRISQYEHDEIGYTARLNTVNAAIARVQLRRLDKWNSERRAHAEEYKRRLAGVSQVRTPPTPEYAQGNYHLYAARVSQRDELFKSLAGKGVQCATNFPIPMPFQPVYRRLYGFKGTEFPASLALSSEVLCLPMFPELTSAEIGAVCDAIAEFYSQR